MSTGVGVCVCAVAVPVCRDAMIELECACDGGKDSLSMAAAAGGETVMAPGNLVVSAYVGCPDVTKVRSLTGGCVKCIELLLETVCLVTFT